MGVVVQRARRPRIIVDYTFYGLNDKTVKMAPRDAMQFGKSLERILQAIVDADPTFGPVQMIKVDIAGSTHSDSRLGGGVRLRTSWHPLHTQT
jgi:hypothetical protein